MTRARGREAANAPALRWLGGAGYACWLATSGCLASGGYKPATNASLPHAAIVFPFDAAGACRLEVSTQDLLADPIPWTAGDLSNRTMEAVERGDFETSAGGSPSRYRVVRLREGDRRMWIRAAGGAPAADPLSCAIDAGQAAALATPIRAVTVRLAPSAPSCHGLTPLLGGTADTTLEPYTVLARRLYRVDQGGTVRAVAGVTLQASARAKLLTVSSEDFNACFAATSQPPPAVDSVRALQGWIVRQERQAAPPPAMNIDDALSLFGIPSSSCVQEGHDATVHQECREAAVGIATHGPTILFTAERIVDAVHGYGGRLVAPEDVVGATIVASPPRGVSYAFGKRFEAALAASLADAEKQHLRAAHGYRLIRPADVTANVVPTGSVEVDMTLSVSEIESSNESRPPAPTVRPAGSQEHARAAGAAARARAALDRANAEAVASGSLLATAAPSCLAPNAPVACDVDGHRAADAYRARQQAAAQLVADADAALAKSPAAPDVNPTDAVGPTAHVLRRRGDLKGKMAIVARDAAHTPPVAWTTVVPFAAESFDGPADAAHAEGAKKAAPPTQEDLERAAAAALVERIDQAVSTWMYRSVAKVDGAALEPGTRAYMALLGRHAASNRRVKLFSDVLDSRPEALSGTDATYPVSLPGAGDAKCYTFVAADAKAGPVDVNLVVSAAGIVVGRDARPEPAAALELCSVRPGPYEARVSWQGGHPHGVFLSIYESTPGAATDDDMRAAALGPPPVLGKPAEKAQATASSSLPR